MADRYTEIVVDEVRARTDNAVLCEFEDKNEPVWIPFSQIDGNTDGIGIGDKDLVLEVATWLVEKEDIPH